MLSEESKGRFKEIRIAIPKAMWEEVRDISRIKGIQPRVYILMAINNYLSSSRDNTKANTGASTNLE